MVDQDNRVVFHDVIVERPQRDGVWVSGLPESARIITIGQGYVSDGEEVSPIPDSTEGEEAAGASAALGLSPDVEAE